MGSRLRVFGGERKKIMLRKEHLLTSLFVGPVIFCYLWVTSSSEENEQKGPRQVNELLRDFGFCLKYVPVANEVLLRDIVQSEDLNKLVTGNDASCRV